MSFGTLSACLSASVFVCCLCCYHLCLLSCLSPLFTCFRRYDFLRASLCLDFSRLFLPFCHVPFPNKPTLQPKNCARVLLRRVSGVWRFPGLIFECFPTFLSSLRCAACFFVILARCAVPFLCPLHAFRSPMSCWRLRLVFCSFIIICSSRPTRRSYAVSGAVHFLTFFPFKSVLASVSPSIRFALSRLIKPSAYVLCLFYKGHQRNGP